MKTRASGIHKNVFIDDTQSIPNQSLVCQLLPKNLPIVREFYNMKHEIPTIIIDLRRFFERERKVFSLYW